MVAKTIAWVTGRLTQGTYVQCCGSHFLGPHLRSVDSKPRQGGEVCGEEQNGKEKFKKIPRRGGLARKNSKNFLIGISLVLQNVQFPCQNEPKCANSTPWQEKCQSNTLPGVVGQKKIDRSTQGILARHRHASTYPAKQCFRKKCPGLVAIF